MLVFLYLRLNFSHIFIRSESILISTGKPQVESIACDNLAISAEYCLSKSTALSISIRTPYVRISSRGRISSFSIAIKSVIFSFAISSLNILYNFIVSTTSCIGYVPISSGSTAHNRPLMSASRRHGILNSS